MAIDKDIVERLLEGRDPKVAAYVLKVADGRCESCTRDAPFRTTDDRPFLEVHHVRPLGEGGSDRVSNTVALCPNCHRAAHHAADSRNLTAGLYKKLARLEPE